MLKRECARTHASNFRVARNQIMGRTESDAAWVCLLRLPTCKAFHFGSVVVTAVYAPECLKDLDVCEKFVKDVTKVLWEGRRAGAKTFHIAGDLSVELVGVDVYR